MSQRWGCQSSRLCSFMVLVCRPKPSLLINNSHAYQSNSLQGRDDVFCLVQFTPLTLQGGKTTKTALNVTSCPGSLAKYQFTFLIPSPPPSPIISRPIHLRGTLYTLLSIDLVHLFLLSGIHIHRDFVSSH